MINARKSSYKFVGRKSITSLCIIIKVFYQIFLQPPHEINREDVSFVSRNREDGWLCITNSSLFINKFFKSIFFFPLLVA